MKLKQVSLFFLFISIIFSTYITAGGYEEYILGKEKRGSSSARVYSEEEMRDMQLKKNFFVLTAYDLGTMGLTGFDQEWTTWRTRVGLLQNGLQLPYLEVSRHSRNNLINYTYDIGGYFDLGSSYAHLEAGWGADSIYQYDFKILAEYTHPFIQYLFLKEKYKYLSINTGEDIHILSPGFIYYFDNHYLVGYVNILLSNLRETSYTASLKLNFNIAPPLDFWIGTEMGQRLYDMTGAFDPLTQEGYVVFTGFRYRITNYVSFFMNLLYGYEEPDYHHKSCEFGVMVEF
ncbi:YaiO family outer membrane beta-barrel protein [Thermoproteota archaeon]